MKKTHDNNQVNTDRRQAKEAADKAVIDKGSNQKSSTGKQGNAAGTVLGKINSNAKKESI